MRPSRRLGPNARLNPTLLQEQIAAVVKEQGETIFSQLTESARQQLRREGLTLKEQIARLERIEAAIESGRSLIATYGAETLGELPAHEQLEFVPGVGGNGRRSFFASSHGQSLSLD